MFGNKHNGIPVGARDVQGTEFSAREYKDHSELYINVQYPPNVHSEICLYPVYISRLSCLIDSTLQTFLTEAGVADQPISQQYMSVWDILKSRYIGTGHFKKAVNLESYYLGYLNTGCMMHK